MGFGHLLKAARKKRGWTMADVAQRLEVSRGYVGQLELDMIVGLPRPQILEAIERELGVSREDIARASGHLGPSTTIDPYAEFKRLAELPTDDARYEELLKLPPGVLPALGVIARTLIARAIDPPNR
jgi:transcriptional regulator with XRE-family HTH domain